MKNPKDRPDLEEILQHQLIKDLNNHTQSTSTKDIKLENRLKKLTKEVNLSEIQTILHE